MKYYVMNLKITEEGFDWAGTEIMYKSKIGMIFNYIDCKTYKCGFSNSKFWNEITQEQVIEILNNKLRDRNSQYMKDWHKRDGFDMDEYEAETNKMVKFINKIKKENK